VQATICVFAKPPIAGQVKTRLAAVFGPAAAALLAQAFLDDTLEAVARVPWARAALATTGPLESPLPLLLQGEGDLGARLERVLRAALDVTPWALAIGADAPALPERFFEEAREGLERGDAVLGPARDGGFYLLGLRDCPPGLLADLPWSSATTCARTEARLLERGMRVTLLEPWFDVDVPDDLLRLQDELQQGSIVAPRTARALSQLQWPTGSSR